MRQPSSNSNRPLPVRRGSVSSAAAFAILLGSLTVWMSTARADRNIVWSDEFNGTTLNTNNWNYNIGNNNGFGTGELEYYTANPENVSVSNGLLHIVARAQSTNGYAYTSGDLTTQGLFYKTYGTFEFRAKLPAGAGLWPAFWMLSQNSPYGGEPNDGEIDVMENLGYSTDKVTGTIHYGGQNGQDYQSGNSYYLPAGQSITDFHVYSLDWTNNAFNWYVDGVLYETQTSWWSNIGTSASRYPYPAPFDTPFFIILQLAVGGSYAGAVDPNALPAEVQLDYVRVYDETAPLRISVTPSNGSLWLSWPSNIVCHLQMETNLLGGTNWLDVPEATNPWVVLPSSGSGFYRLASP